MLQLPRMALLPRGSSRQREFAVGQTARGSSRRAQTPLAWPLFVAVSAAACLAAALTSAGQPPLPKLTACFAEYHAAALTSAG